MSRGTSIQPYLLLLVFVGPLLLAAGAYYGAWDWVRTDTAHGVLLETPQALPDSALTMASGASTSTAWLKSSWSLIYARATPCSGLCIDLLNRINQVRLALGKDMGRAQVVMLFVGDAPTLPAGADVTLARLDDDAGAVMVEFFDETEIRDGWIYVADPLGRLVITYSPDIEQKELLEDLERLLAIR